MRDAARGRDPDPAGDPAPLPLLAAECPAARLRADRHHAGRHHGRLDVLHALSPPAGRPAHDPRVPGDGVPREGRGAGARCRGAALGARSLARTRTRAGEFTVQPVACLGCCTLAPVVQIDDVTYGRVTPRSVPAACDARPCGRQRRRARSRSRRPTRDRQTLGEIRIGLGSCCQAQGSGKVHDEILAVLHESGAAAAVKRVGCIGMCHQTPLMQLVTPAGDSQFFSHVQPQDVRSIVLRHFRPRGLVRRLGYRLSRWLDEFHSNEEEDPVVTHALDVREQAVCAFLGPQKHIATEFCGDLDPLDLDEYLRHDGFVALRRCLDELDPRTIVDEVRRSGLRGRGGGGFPTHIKWQKAQEAPGDTKYVICNGDEGDPGAFMDRMLLESFPYRVIEGMAIAARRDRSPRGDLLHPRRVSAGGQTDSRSHPAVRTTRPDRRRRAGQRPAREVPHHGRSRRVHLRRRDRADQLDGRPSRHAHAAPALSGGSRTLGTSHADQQRGDAGLFAVDLSARRGRVRQAGHGLEQGHESLRAGRQSGARRA